MDITISRRAALAGLAALLAGCGSTRAAAPAGTTDPASDPASDPTPAPATDPTVSPIADPIDTAAPPSEAVATMADLALVSADGRVAILRGGVIAEPVTGLVSSDGRTLVTTSAGDDGTAIAWFDLVAGVSGGSVTVAGHVRAIAANPSGGVIALTTSDQGATTTAGAAISTEIVVVDHDGEVFRRRYDTELLPEGFATTTDPAGRPTSMFVQEFLDPPESDPQAPRWYQVRVLDFSTGELSLPFNLRDKTEQVDEQMLGFGRTHVQSDANDLLFTLYRGVYEDDSEYAFVHTLGFFAGVWCLDLPSELQLAWESGALALIDDERSLLVVSANGCVSEFRIADITDVSDSSEAAVMPVARRTVQAWTPSAEADGPAAASSAASIVVGQGNGLRWLDPATLTEVASLDLGLRIECVHVVADASNDVIAVGSGRVVRIRPKGRDLVAEVPLPAGFDGVTRVVALSS